MPRYSGRPCKRRLIEEWLVILLQPVRAVLRRQRRRRRRIRTAGSPRRSGPSLPLLPRVRRWREIRKAPRTRRVAGAECRHSQVLRDHGGTDRANEIRVGWRHRHQRTLVKFSEEARNTIKAADIPGSARSSGEFQTCFGRSQAPLPAMRDSLEEMGELARQLQEQPESVVWVPRPRTGETQMSCLTGSLPRNPEPAVSRASSRQKVSFNMWLS